MSKYLAMAIMQLHPDADPSRDFDVVDDGSAAGPRLTAWRLPAPRPTPAQLEAATLLAARQERKNALALQERSTIVAAFGSMGEFQRTAALDPADRRMGEARAAREARRLDEKIIDQLPLKDLETYRTESEKRRGK